MNGTTEDNEQLERGQLLRDPNNDEKIDAKEQARLQYDDLKNDTEKLSKKKKPITKKKCLKKNDQIRKELIKLKKENDELKAEKRELIREKANVEKEKNLHRSRERKMTKRMEELGKLKKENDELKANNQRLQLEKTNWEKERERFQTNESEIKEQFNKLKKENDELKANNQRLKLEKKNWEKQNVRLEEKVKPKQFCDPTSERDLANVKVKGTQSFEKEQLHWNYETDEIKRGIWHSFKCDGLGTESGVLKYLKKNPPAEKLVATRSSDGPGEANMILCSANSKTCGTKEENGSWWHIDLGENHLLFITHCTLKRNAQDPILGKWELKGSVDGLNWEELGKRQLAGASACYIDTTCTWAVQNKEHAFRYFRILQKGENRKKPKSSGKCTRYGIFLTNVELHGELVDIKHEEQMSKRRTKSKPLRSLLEDESSLQEICEVLDTAAPACGNYRHVAQHYGFNDYQIKATLRTHSGGPSRGIIESLAARKPELTVEEFAVATEKKTKRKDVSQLLRKYDTADEGSL